MNRLRTILIERLDRLARELLIQECILRVLRDLKKFGVTLLSTTEECLDSDPTRILLREIMGAIAEYDRSTVVLKLRAARLRRRDSTGRCEGRKPFGCDPRERGSRGTNPGIAAERPHV